MKYGICEICNERNILEKHHIISRCFGGNNNKNNICLICSNCHTKVHHGLIILETKIFTLSGIKLIYHRKGEDSITNMEIDKVYLI
jgi:5-methylcytosine-specific restriction endonuclease McrA